jgi:hypothetical protein
MCEKNLRWREVTFSDIFTLKRAEKNQIVNTNAGKVRVVEDIDDLCEGCVFECCQMCEVMNKMIQCDARGIKVIEVEKEATK